MIHISVKGPRAFCGRRALVALTFHGIVWNFGLASWLYARFGCQDCLEALNDALATARPIR